MKRGDGMSCKSLCAVATLAVSTLMLIAASHAQAVDDKIGLVTGPKTGTYFAFGRDIAKVASKADVQLSVKASEGSIDNIKRINSGENAALGIVQSDVLGFLARSKSPDSMRMASNLRMVFPLYNEEIHVLARNNIRSMEDLKGKNVAVGEDGSGNMLTALNLFSLLGIDSVHMSKISSTQGVTAVLKGELDAVIFVGGKPVRLFKNMEDLSLPENERFASLLQQVHFLPLNEPRLLEEYKPAKITSADYKFVREDVPTVAAQAVLISYDFSQHNTERCEALERLSQALRDNLPSLKRKGHPKWKEVDLNAPVANWKKDQCAWSEPGRVGVGKSGDFRLVPKPDGIDNPNNDDRLQDIIDPQERTD